MYFIANWLLEKNLISIHPSLSLLFQRIYCPFRLTWETVYVVNKNKSTASTIF